MKEEKRTETIEKIITTYHSDDGKFNSTNKRDVEVYEAKQKCSLYLVTKFTLPTTSNDYFVYKISSREELILLEDFYRNTYYGGVRLESFSEEDIPSKVCGYVICCYEDWSDWPTTSIEPLDRFIDRLSDTIKQEQKELKQKVDALNLLKDLKNE